VALSGLRKPKETLMSRSHRVLAGAVALAFSTAAVAQPPPLDPAVIAFQLPDQIKWTDNPRGGNRSAVLQGDPSKPGPYAVLLQWLPGHMSRPHFHPNDRHFLVVSGTWWVGAGSTFDPNATVPLPAGSSVTHFAKGVHFDGAKDEQATILVWGEGPATSTPFAAPPSK
jgi:hypothetical protein